MRRSALSPHLDIRDDVAAGFPEVTFRVLGPLALAKGSDTMVLPPSKVATLLAALLLSPNEVVSIGALQQAIWGEDQPVAAKGALQTCAMRLRQLFVRHEIMATTIETVPGGYRIVGSAESVDLVRFRELARAAGAQPRPDRELTLLDAALALWHGPLMANVPSDTLHRDVVPRLNEERLRVLERVCDLKIELGQAASALVQLWEATRAHPGNERLAAQLIEALYRTGRQSEALAEYRRVKDYLAAELAVDPGAPLQRLELNILNGWTPDASTSAVSAWMPDPADRPTVVPPRGFVGRAAAVARISARLVSGSGFVVVTGPPGVGKSALAGHVAAAIQEGFPAGALLLTMRTESGEPRAQADVAAQMVRRPRSGTSCRGLWILDDVAGVQQVVAAAAHLVPGDAVVITSPFGLAGVVARFGGWIERLEGLDPPDSLILLSELVGADRVGAESAAAGDLAEVCAHFPLALRIAAARLLDRPEASVADSVAWLREDPIGRLALPGDDDMSLMRRFDALVSRLSPALADAFLRLGTSSDRSFGMATVAGLLDVGLDAAESIVDRLTDASLLTDRGGHVFVPELLRLYSHAVTALRTEFK